MQHALWTDPAALGGITALTLLDVSSNALTGNIPATTILAYCKQLSLVVLSTGAHVHEGHAYCWSCARGHRTSAALRGCAVASGDVWAVRRRRPQVEY